MRLIDAAEYQARKAKLYRCYGRLLPYPISFPFGWLSTLEEMLVILDMTLKPESLEKIRFIKISSRPSAASLEYITRDGIDQEDEDRAFELVSLYTQIASDKCEVCGLPGKEILKDGYYSMLCSTHSDLC